MWEEVPEAATPARFEHKTALLGRQVAACHRASGQRVEPRRRRVPSTLPAAPPPAWDTNPARRRRRPASAFGQLDRVDVDHWFASDFGAEGPPRNDPGLVVSSTDLRAVSHDGAEDEAAAEAIKASGRTSTTTSAIPSCSRPNSTASASSTTRSDCTKRSATSPPTTNTMDEDNRTARHAGKDSPEPTNNGSTTTAGTNTQPRGDTLTWIISTTISTAKSETPHHSHVVKELYGPASDKARLFACHDGRPLTQHDVDRTLRRLANYRRRVLGCARRRWRTLRRGACRRARAACNATLLASG